MNEKEKTEQSAETGQAHPSSQDMGVSGGIQIFDLSVN